MLETPDGRVLLAAAVWEHFSDLRHIRRLAQATGTRIIVFDEPFDPSRRRDYVSAVVSRLATIESPKIVFLDPDTGIEPGASGPEHVAKADLLAIWAALSAKAILALYQHADHSSTWRRQRARKMAEACAGSPVHFIIGPGMAADVAMLWCEKSPAA